MNNITFKQFDELRAAGENVILLDVRNTDEFDAGHFDDAINMPLHLLPLRYQELPPNEHIIVYCRRGGRSSQAVQFLASVGYTNVSLLEEGYEGYLESHA